MKQAPHSIHSLSTNLNDDENEDNYELVHNIIKKKMIKLDDDGDNEPDNIIEIYEKKDMNLGPAGQIWECAMVLGKYFLKQSYENKINFKGKKIIELGCGTGIVGIILGILGANVLCTDLSAVQNLCEQNINENNTLIQKNGGSVKFQIIDWKAPQIKIQDNLKQFSFDKDISYIIASDSIYNSGLLEIFPKFLRALYDTIKGEDDIFTYIGYKCRHDQIDRQISEYFEKQGFWEEQILEKEMDSMWKNNSINLYILS